MSAQRFLLDEQLIRGMRAELRLLGADNVRDDLARLRGSIRDRSGAPQEPASG